MKRSFPGGSVIKKKKKNPAIQEMQQELRVHFFGQGDPLEK